MLRFLYAGAMPPVGEDGARVLRALSLASALCVDELVGALSDVLAAAAVDRAQLTTLLHFSEAEGLQRLARLVRERIAGLA